MAARIFATVHGGGSGVVASADGALAALPPGVATTTVEIMAATRVPPAPPAAPTPAAPTPVAPPAAPTPAAPTPVAPPAPPAPPEVDTSAPPGWTIDHVKGAATAFTSNTAKGGAAALQAILQRYVPPGAKPTIKNVPGSSWPALYAELTA